MEHISMLHEVCALVRSQRVLGTALVTSVEPSAFGTCPPRLQAVNARQVAPDWLATRACTAAASTAAPRV